MLRHQLLTLLTGLSLPLLSSLSIASNEAVLGHWNTLDRNGKAQSLVELYLNGDQLNGRIVKLYDESKQGALCQECEGEQHDQPIAGLVFITGLKAAEDEWVDGRVLDPETGSEYDCKLWLDGDNLKLKAGFGFIGQTREWQRPAP
ncbi:DUF2147 domain-containing protein [Aestuariicella hydrocarbonica]|uniref:DUF2147 domain-containing protein n=1 Tax=Pseudomaricurvus hydrocarbonicus TaxID=1470433 RepID=A0A9E5JZK1_9GAMM|nr:DUF2147 domain-containing protein [Aestuariicella hydrocarbonica]NHO65522.1 DUF2147 domain-containing protein [Aestuariicella hydrocarbonica]